MDLGRQERQRRAHPPRDLLVREEQAAEPRMAMPAIPPTTPPTIALTETGRVITVGVAVCAEEGAMRMVSIHESTTPLRDSTKT